LKLKSAIEEILMYSIINAFWQFFFGFLAKIALKKHLNKQKQPIAPRKWSINSIG